MKKTLIFFALLLGALQPAGAQCCRDQVKQQCQKKVCDSAAVCKAAHHQQGDCVSMQACVKDQQCDKSKACTNGQHCDKLKAKNLRSSALKTRAKAQLSGKSKK